MLRRVIGLGLCLVVFAALAAEVNLYSAREEALIKPLLDEFSTAHGTTVNLVTGEADALLKRLESEGQNSPADLILTTDVGPLAPSPRRQATATRGIQGVARGHPGPVPRR